MAVSLGTIRDYLWPCVNQFVPGASLRADFVADLIFLVDLEHKEHLILSRHEIEDGADWRQLGPARIRELVGLSAPAEPPDYMGATRAMCGR